METLKTTRKIKVINKEHEGFLKTQPAVTYGKGKVKNGELEFPVNQVKGKGWRLVHDGKKARHLFKIESEKALTTSVYEMITGATEKEVIKKAKELKLDLKGIEGEA